MTGRALVVLGDPLELATRLFGPDPDVLPGRWTTDHCGIFPECPRCREVLGIGCQGIGHWRFDPRLPKRGGT